MKVAAQDWLMQGWKSPGKAMHIKFIMILSYPLILARQPFNSLYPNIRFRMYRLILSILMLLLVVSCRKEGCMDINSASYDPGAKVNDGMCTYRYLRTITVVSMDEWQDAYTR